ncbi:MAG: TrmH family RNA methyltransferase [Dokdonella sp.]|uniref:TrmH family RNA methyltransferase n=1 Tax=Dokdonella sp. TaxID=2291710 RepID=UPI002C2E35CD|nr:rRNA methyltransferase [Xanthomonadales bacterium]HQW77336.1 TrmH family RNA methyltransferase [Dokdonella sp.]MBK7210979.1 rRNA methyltransferase [Xanthomonadales bacterium]MBL0222817.1 rRNA methyltransferase [Xanthomonadales bacterium]HQY54244.1 TrmH family RNA methyltransferase [Dokdonella sp.]
MSENKWKSGKNTPISPWKQRTDAPARAPAPRETAAEHAETESRPQRPSGEMRLYGINACLAAFARRPGQLRKVYLLESRIAELKPVLAWCVKHRLGYRVVESADLDKLTGSRHHEGICFEMLRPPALSLEGLLAAQPRAPAPSLLIWLDGVGNPHNLGALLRSAAHFGVAGVIVPATSSLDLSGAAARVAEGGAEVVPLVRIEDDMLAFASLRAAGYRITATLPRGGEDLYATRLEPRKVLVFGAEGEGMSKSLVEAADHKVSIPGSGIVESLNISVSAAVVLGEYWRQLHASPMRR